ncbi:MAG: dockerin type I repeat-containing protein, partial [Planctomycetota bacterium]
NPAGLLRYRTVAPTRFSGSADWSLLPDRSAVHAIGEIPVSVPAAGVLASRGRLPVIYNLSGQDPVLSPGVRRVVVEARLPIDQEAGDYSYSVLPSSQVVLSNGEVFHPTLEKSSATINLAVDVPVGWDGPTPEFDGDESTGRLGGPVEFRVLGGEAPAGGTVPVRVQMRSAVPLNRLYVQLGWPGGELECPEPADEGLALSDEEGRPYQVELVGCLSRGTLGAGHMSARMSLAGHLSNISNEPDRFLESFHISQDSWTDVARFEMTVSESLPEGTVIPLQFRRYDWDELRTRSGLLYVPPPAVFYPFTPEYSECGRENWADFEEERWTYDYRYQDGQVVVTEGGNPVEPPDIGLEISVGEARVAPGESALVPVFIQADEVPRTLRVPVSFDVERVEIDAFEYDVLDFRTAELVRVRVERDSIDLYSNCIELPDGRLECEYGIPYSTIFHSSPEGFAVIDLNPNPPFGDARDFLSPDEPRLLGWFDVRLKEGARGGSELTVESVPYYTGPGVEDQAVPGAFLLRDEEVLFAPADRLTDGAVRAGASFVRGDSNLDGAADLSDAVFTLSHLFLGGVTPTCSDAADTDGSETIDISDPIYLLRSLFAGGAFPPAPYPDCGQGPVSSGIGCLEAGCVP